MRFMSMSRLHLLTFLLLTCTHGAGAETPRVDHYEGEPSPSLEVALDNLATYNARLAAIVEGGEPTALELNDIHQLTYTIENALARIAKDVATAATTLEEVHLASEKAEAGVSVEQARHYLDQIRPLTE